MRQLIAALFLVAALLLPQIADAGSLHKHYGNQGGHYIGGHGSSHKGSHYSNPRTGNHYTHHNG